MLRLKGISKSFPQRGVVLNDLDLLIREGESLAVTGPSGSGKTTLMNLIGMLDRPDSGKIEFRGKSLASFTDDEAARYRNRDIGFVFQDHLLMPYLTVYENILLPLYAGKLSTEEYTEKKMFATLLMEKAEIISLKDKYPFHISGGEAQRVAVVRALINKPSVLLADEPTGSLDSKNASMLADLLVSLNKEIGTSLLVTTHSDKLASQMGTRLRLENGRLV